MAKGSQKLSDMRNVLSTYAVQRVMKPLQQSAQRTYRGATDYVKKSFNKLGHTPVPVRVRAFQTAGNSQMGFGFETVPLKDGVRYIEKSVGKGTGNFANKNFASRDLLESHFEKHAVKNNEFHGAYNNADQYMQGARDVMSSGTKVGYQYKGETRTGYVKFMGNSRKGEAKFEFVGTNANGNVTTYHVKRGEDLWKLLNNNKRDKTINPME
ncbi:hypothetical protein [Metabacillus iocasae]|uniref:Uncharacterized protein n=1 Tax=Priestia iocasae TaxID=2291674 RepID=A0ABS2QS86_9BACI|nr:hypothetical protein [Metabacillus iocasae]MBM7702275.1 hypothetical protein [Metabacillus iocasae]